MTRTPRRLRSVLAMRLGIPCHLGTTTLSDLEAVRFRVVETTDFQTIGCRNYG